MAAIHTDFKGTVRQRRGDRLRASDEELFEGQIWTGARLRNSAWSTASAICTLFCASALATRSSCPRSAPRARGGDAGSASGRRDAEAGAIADAVLDVIAERTLWARYGLASAGADSGRRGRAGARCRSLDFEAARRHGSGRSGD